VDLAERVDPPPNDLDAQRQQSKPRFSLAQAAVTVGDAETAREGFLREIRERRRRLDRFEGDANAYRDLYVALYNYAEFLRKVGEADVAAPLLDESLDMRRKLLERAPKNPTLRRDVALGLFAGGINALLRGDAKEALDNASEAAGVFQTLVSDQPGDARSYATLAFGYAESAEAALEAARADLARGWTEDLENTIRQLEAAAMSHTSLPELRARQLLLSAQLALEDDPSESERLFTLARDQLVALSNADDSSVFAKRRLADALFGMGEARLRTAGSDAPQDFAVAAFRSARAIYSELRDIGPVAAAPRQREARLAEVLASSEP
jgi:tetratricopeptide (TPR) repeat protein